MATQVQMPSSLIQHHQNQSNHNNGAMHMTVPVMGQLMTDEDIGLFQGIKTAPLCLPKIVKLLTDHHSAHLIDRHVHALKKIVKHYSIGFPLKDLVLVFKILNVCVDRVCEHPEYITPISDVLKLCALPYLKEKSSEDIYYQQIATESIEQLGYLMRVPNSQLRSQICETLRSFYCSGSPLLDTEKYKPTSLTYNQKIVDRSDVAETIIKSLSLADNDLGVKLAILDLLQKLSKKSISNCNRMLNAEGAKKLCCQLMTSDPTLQVLFRSVEILWNLLENGSQEETARQLNDVYCISQLRDAFLMELTHGYRHFDRQLRNDLLVIASLISSVCYNAPFLETGFARQLILFATFQEVKCHNALVKHLKLMPNHEDFEMKKLLINMMVLLSRDPSALPILSEGRLILALFSYVKGNELCCSSKDWNPAQYEEIQLHAMAALSTLCPLMLDDYMTCQGSTRLLLMLEWCLAEDNFSGYGNSFYGNSGCGSKRAQMRLCIRLIRGVISTYEESILTDYADQGAICQFINVLESLKQLKEYRMKEQNKEEDAVDIEMQSDLLVVLSILCKHDMHRKELFGMAGVDILIHYLKMDVRLLTSGLGHNRLLLTAIHCTWYAVIGCYLTEDYFLENEGVFLLIDLLEACPNDMQSQILGTLLDLLENQKTLSHVNAWRGKHDCTAAHLLCDIWRQEEIRMKVKRTRTSAIADPQKPLAGQLQDSSPMTSLPATCPSPAIVDVYENMRAKIFAVFSKTGFVELNGLTTEDHITLSLIEHYLELKIGEIWNETKRELEAENTRPISPDREALEAISTAVNIREDQVVQIQKDLMEAEEQQHLVDEQEYYAEIRENHREIEKRKSEFADYLARTSKFLLLKAAKERQELSIEASRVQCNPKAMNHITHIPCLNVTAFCGRNMTVESTPAYLTGGPLARYDPETGTLRERETLENLCED